MADIDPTRHREELAIEPALPIIDSHHHLRDRPGHGHGHHYLFPDFLKDITTGHNVIATVAVECGDMYRTYGAPELRPLGETEFLTGMAAMFASGKYGATLACLGIVGFAELRRGNRVMPVIEASLAIAGDRFRGIRNPVAWHESPAFRGSRVGSGGGLLLDASFREGFACLSRYNLSFDAWIYHPQLSDMLDLARAFPDTRIILNHIGGPLGIDQYKGKEKEVFAAWSASMKQLGTCPNIYVKLGGLRRLGLQVESAADSAESTLSAALAKAWRPHIETCIEAFGADHCMFESNFPADRETCSYTTIWNAFKRLTSGYSPSERDALFSGTAAQAYRLTVLSLAERGTAVKA